MKPDVRQHQGRGDRVPEHEGDNDSDGQLTRSAAGDAAAFTPLVEKYSTARQGQHRTRRDGP